MNIVVSKTRSIVKILGISVSSDAKEEILEKIKKGLNDQKKFIHVVSLNPENLVVASKNRDFFRVLTEAEIRVNDGVGVVLASRLLYGYFVPRLTGVDLMENVLKRCSNQRIRVLFIGGKPNLAKELADCYSRSYPASKFVGIAGFKDIKNPRESEQKAIDSIVADLRPNLIFVAFGSPDQELWIERNRALLRGVVCIGVGGAFDFLSGSVSRSPHFIRRLGLEWLYRLVRQPWRWRRQLRLLVFIWLVVKERFGLNESHHG